MITSEISSAVEEYTWNHIKKLLDIYNPSKEGVVIDAGAGVDNFYFEWLAQLGYKTALVEPLPCIAVMERIDKYHVSLIQAALCHVDGKISLHTQADGFLHSVRPELWGQTIRTTDVDGIRWNTMMRMLRCGPPSLLKLDIEGAEPDVILQFSEYNCPDILSFEFGGVSRFVDGIGAWSFDAIVRIKSAMKHLKSLGYLDGMAFVCGQSTTTRTISLDNPYFHNEDSWGNIVVSLPRPGAVEAIWPSFRS